MLSLAKAFQHHGCKTELIDAAQSVEDRPILAGYAREGGVMPLIQATRLVGLVRACNPHLCLVPLRGGLAHCLLMARACGDLPAELRIVLVAEEPTRSVALRSDWLCDHLAFLVADAMERFCMTRADSVLTKAGHASSWFNSFDIEQCPEFEPIMGLGLNESFVVKRDCRSDELAFVGPFERSAYVVDFIDAVERLAVDGRVKRVLFVGPIEDGHLSPGREWLGRRAGLWPFEFRIVNEHSLESALAFAARSEALLFLPGFPTAYLDRSKELVSRAQLVGSCCEHTPAQIFEALSGGYDPAARSIETLKCCVASSEAITRIALREPIQRRDPVGLSVCILHHDRPRLLKQAVASVMNQIGLIEEGLLEVIIFDNGSTSDDSRAALAELAVHPFITIVFNKHALPNAAALNAMTAKASRPFVAFLDDDNLLAPGGVAAILRACRADQFDVLASSLEIFDHDDLTQRHIATMTFIGPAYTAGLFFNGFGDTAMIFRRSAFESLGGFLETGGPLPASDWLLLARAQAAGLRIGVLQTPAFHYRRDLARADVNWQKYDQYGVRQIVLRHYGDQYDALLLAKLSQSLMIELS